MYRCYKSTLSAWLLRATSIEAVINLNKEKRYARVYQLICLPLHREDSCYRVHIEQKYCTQKLELKFYIGDNECKPSIPENFVVLG